MLYIIDITKNFPVVYLVCMFAHLGMALLVFIR